MFYVSLCLSQTNRDLVICCVPEGRLPASSEDTVDEELFYLLTVGDAIALPVWRLALGRTVRGSSFAGESDLPFPKTGQTGTGADPAVMWVSAFFPDVKWPGREADCSLPSRAEVKNELYLYSIAVAYRGGCSNPPRNSEDIGGVLDRMSKKNRRLDFLM